MDRPVLLIHYRAFRSTGNVNQYYICIQYHWRLRLLSCRSRAIIVARVSFHVRGSRLPEIYFRADGLTDDGLDQPGPGGWTEADSNLYSIRI